MKKNRKRKLYYCKICTGKFSKDLVKTVEGHYVCLTCASIEEYLKNEAFPDYYLNGGRYKVRD